MKLSVIIPVYNGAEFIQKSYDSIMNQNLQDYELLYINNNSTDNSVEIIEALQEKNDRIKIYHQTRQGEAQARNMGIDKAQGDYIYQLDVDDEVFPGAVNKMIAVLDTHPNMDAVFGRMLKSDKVMAETVKPSDETHEIIIKDKPHWGLVWFSDLSSVVGAAAFLYRRSVFERLGSYTEKLKIIGTDTAFDINLGMTSNVAFIDTYVYLYFKHQVSLVETVKKKMHRVFMQWPRLVLCHVPYHLKHPDQLDFKRILFKQLYVAMGKILNQTEGVSNRRHKKKELINDIQPIKLPYLLNLFLNLLVLFNNDIFYKFYVHYVVSYYIKNKLKDL